MGNWIFTYTNGKFTGRASDPDMRAIIVSEHPRGYGMMGEFVETFKLPINPLTSSTFLEWFDDGEYYRVPCPEVSLGTPLESAYYTPLPVRHAGWPGRSRREIRLALEKQRSRRIQKRLERARALKVRLEREEVRRAEEAAWEVEALSELENELGSEESEYQTLMEAEFGEEWARYS